MAPERKALPRIIPAAIVLLVLGALAIGFFFEKTRYFMEMLYERPRLEKTLKGYFAAEMRGDLGTVYGYLAPSSDYRETHTYQDFLKEMSSSPVKILSYEIVDIYGLRPNNDPEHYPRVERFAQVEVDVVVQYTDTGSTAEYNFCFTFLKEGGAWFKG